MHAIEVRMLPIGQLVPADYNPRTPLTPTDRAYRKLKRSLERFGLVEPLVWNELSGRVVGGHLRLTILKELGVAEVPVSVVRLSDAAERSLNVVLNNREAQGRFAPGKLAVLLQELDGLPEFDDTGFDRGVLRSLTYEPDGVLATEDEPDRVEVVLVMTAAKFEALSEPLTTAVAEWDVECHVRRS
ncbi:MAG: ParB N-terminal domain-containing protein [Fimbriiglobus sp.]|jgi:ParB-like chromosome segregation protein Spo0J|nr:ParB N-terminal domain-containing protein [Fimbriiglobus sp.]